LRFRATDIPGEYIIHCHMLRHEDHGMMSSFYVCDNATTGGVGASTGCPVRSWTATTTTSSSTSSSSTTATGTSSSASSSTGSSSSCNGGYYLSSGSCVQCAVGKYNSVRTASVCSDCAVGKYNPSLAQVQCRSCLAGTYQASTGSTVCTSCAAGTYQASTAQSYCSDCAFGTTSAAGASTCSALAVIGNSTASDQGLQARQRILRIVAFLPLMIVGIALCIGLPYIIRYRQIKKAWPPCCEKKKKKGHHHAVHTHGPHLTTGKHTHEAHGKHETKPVFAIQASNYNLTYVE